MLSLVLAGANYLTAYSEPFLVTTATSMFLLTELIVEERYLIDDRFIRVCCKICHVDLWQMDLYHKTDDAGPSFTRLLMDIEHLNLGVYVCVCACMCVCVCNSALLCTQVQWNILKSAVTL